MFSFRNLLAAAIVVISGPAFAGEGNWNDQKNEPGIYQTNTYYGPITINAPTGIPAGAVITNVTHYWGYNASTYPADPSYSLEAKFCNLGTGGTCRFQNAGNKTGATDLNDTGWAGQPANGNWTFSVHAIASVNKVFVAALTASRQYKVSVNYSY